MLTLMDPLYERMQPFGYTYKVISMLMLFFRPFVLVEVIRKYIVLLMPIEEVEV